MADYLRDELGKLLDGYDERRRAVLAREQKVRDDDALFVAQFAELRRSVIRPAFEAAKGTYPLEKIGRQCVEEELVSSSPASSPDSKSGPWLVIVGPDELEKE